MIDALPAADKRRHLRLGIRPFLVELVRPLSCQVSNSSCEQADIHLIKLEGVFFPAAIGGYGSVAV